MERDQLAVTQFSASDLRPGAYFWRVRATAASGQCSDWSEPQKFIVMAPGVKSTISVSNLAAVYLGGNVFIIRGKTSPGITVQVSGRESIAASDGAFQVQITAPPSTREITIQVSDSQGNNSHYQVPLK